MIGNLAQILHAIYYILLMIIMKKEVAIEERQKNYWKSCFSYREKVEVLFQKRRMEESHAYIS